MVRTIDLQVAPFEAGDVSLIRRRAAAALGVSEREITDLRIRRRSLDARRHRLCLQLRVDVYVGEPPEAEPPLQPAYPDVSSGPPVIIVGAGPAGMFAALRLIELGLRPVIIERGKDVQARRRDLAAIQRGADADPDSNYCFGEGGAGTYSDGKLYTRATKRGSVDRVLQTLVAHGAPDDILVDAHPHIGSNRLPKVVVAMRESILGAGGEIHFESRVSGIGRDAEGRAVSVTSRDGREWRGCAVILATGHSARDIFSLLHDTGVAIDAKAFAVGVRVEHPQPLIDRIQYHGRRDASLPSASYRLAATVRERGVFSFCMCPGGFIVPSATAPGEVVVNGMSLSRRDSPFANSGMVVAVEPEDLSQFAGDSVLAGVTYQRQLEAMADAAGGGMQRAPAQRLTDFLAARGSASLPKCSYRPGIRSAPLHELLPPSLAERLADGLRQFGRSMRGYVTEEAVLVGVETRTSSPVRIPRDNATLEHPDVPGLYPCGEGAGYAGGIVSAALDGMRVAEACAALSPLRRS